MHEPEMILRNKSDPSVNAATGSVAVCANDVKIGTGDIKNDKSVGEGMQVKDGEVNITVNNNNSKTVTNSLASRFNKLPDVPVALPNNDMSMEK